MAAPHDVLAPAVSAAIARALGPEFEGTDPVLEWAVVADPSGNEFCVIRELPEPNVPT